MVIIFLDFDGVITTEKTRYKLDPAKLELLKEILDETGAKLVISSSWRKYTLEATKEYLSTVSHFVPFPFPFVDDIIGVTERLSYQCSETYYHSVPRGEEIELWINKWNKHNEDKIENYIILDDDLDMLISQKNHFIHTHWKTGLNKRDVKKAIKILNGEN